MSKEVTIIKTDKESIEHIEFLLETSLNNYLSNDNKEIILELFKDRYKEIERLNNIINELENYINETKLEEFEKAYGRRYGKTFTQAEVIICNMILNKLQELKGSEK